MSFVAVGGETGVACRRFFCKVDPSNFTNSRRKTSNPLSQIARVWNSMRMEEDFGE
jgi:hypothetical protein